jgi:hypothetical protein
MNLLRSYPVDEAPAALRALGAGLVEGGLLVEGTCGPAGEVLTASWIRRRDGALVREALLLNTDFSGGFAPKMFWPRLPRDLRRLPEVDALIARWDAAWRQSRTQHDTDVDRFAASVRGLSDGGDAVSTDPWLLGRGVLLWAAPPALQA